MLKKNGIQVRKRFGLLRASGSRCHYLRGRFFEINTPFNLGDHGYFIIYDSNGTDIMHPIAKDIMYGNLETQNTLKSHLIISYKTPPIRLKVEVGILFTLGKCRLKKVLRVK